MRLREDGGEVSDAGGSAVRAVVAVSDARVFCTNVVAFFRSEQEKGRNKESNIFGPKLRP